MGRQKIEEHKEKISITIDSDLREKIEALASADDRTISSYINRVLRKALEDDAEKHGIQ